MQEAESRGIRVTAQKYWPQLGIIALGIGLAVALFVLQRSPIGGRNIVKITGVDAVYYFATAHSLLFDRDFDLSNEFRSLDPHALYRTREADLTNGMPENPFAIGYPLLSIPFLQPARLWMPSWAVPQTDTPRELCFSIFSAI